MDIVGVPVQVSDTAVVLTGVEHDQIEKVSNGEVTPDTEVVVHLDLTDWHPFEVSSDSVHLALINGNTAIGNERCLGVVEVSLSITVGVLLHD